jgi:hypothetical protein
MNTSIYIYNAAQRCHTWVCLVCLGLVCLVFLRAAILVHTCFGQLRDPSVTHADTVTMNGLPEYNYVDTMDGVGKGELKFFKMHMPTYPPRNPRSFFYICKTLERCNQCRGRCYSERKKYLQRLGIEAPDTEAEILSAAASKIVAKVGPFSETEKGDFLETGAVCFDVDLKPVLTGHRS